MLDYIILADANPPYVRVYDANSLETIALFDTEQDAIEYMAEQHDEFGEYIETDGE